MLLIIQVRAVNEGGPGGWSESLTESTDQTCTSCPDRKFPVQYCILLL